jgi:hypothetical protein
MLPSLLPSEACRSETEGWKPKFAVDLPGRFVIEFAAIKELFWEAGGVAGLQTLFCDKKGENVHACSIVCTDGCGVLRHAGVGCRIDGIH